MNSSLRTPTISLRQLGWAALASMIFVPLAFWGVSLDEVWRIMQQADLRAVALAVCSYVLTNLAKTARWQVFFQPRRVAFSALFAALTIGQVVNFLLPGRLGEVARIYVLRRRVDDRVARMLGTIGAEKLVELAMLFGLTALVAPFVPLPDWLRDPSLRLSAVVLGAILLLALVFSQQARLRKVWAWLGAKLLRAESERMERQFDLTLEGFAPLRQRALRWKILLWSLVIWCLAITTNYVLFFALPMRPSWLMATVLLLVLQVGVAVPTTPGKIGIFQYLATLTLSLFGVSRELALGYGMLLYLAVYVPQIVMAGPFIWQELISLRRLRRLRRAPAPSLESVP